MLEYQGYVLELESYIGNSFNRLPYNHINESRLVNWEESLITMQILNLLSITNNYSR